MILRTTAITLAALAVPASASAATLAVDRPCYLESEAVAVTGAGFGPSLQYSATFDGSLLGSGATLADGSLTAGFSAPTLRDGVGQSTFTLAVTDSAGTAASAPVTISRLAAFFNANGNVATLKSPFQVFGFGKAKTVYVHRIGPDGRHRGTTRLGKTTGPCGRVRTKALRVFPAGSARSGVWRFQFDTRKSFKKFKGRTRVNPPVVVERVKVTRRFG